MMQVIEKFEHLKIPLEAIKLATDNFSDKNCIGGGGFGKVYKGELVLSCIRKIVALKRLDSKFGQGNPEFWKEIIFLSLYKHENIVSLLGFCDESAEKILIYEYASRGSLDSYLDNDALKWIARLNICIGAARGLAYLHDPGVTQQRVLHRDIKSSNILLDENWSARIADFGLSKFGPANQQYTFLVSNGVGTIGYCDPLYVETGLLTKESDVYSFGVVLFEVLCGRLSIGNNPDKCRPLTRLVRQYYEEDNIIEIVHANLKDEITSNSLQTFTEIAYQCLSRDFKRRPVMTEVVSKLERALQYQLALLLHQELNSSPRVPRMPRMRNAGSLPQLASTTPTTSTLMKRTSSSGAKDNGLVSRKKNKDLSNSGSSNSREFDGPKKVHSRRLHEPVKNGSEKTVSSGPSSYNEANENTHQNASDEETGGPTYRTLPGLIADIMSKGERMTYEELCNVVLPHWPNLRKHNGERYVYSSHSQAVLDCLRNRSEWSRLVDRGPKANAGRKRRKYETNVANPESEDDYSTDRNTKDIDSNDVPKGKRKARKHRRVALQGRGIKDIRRRRKADVVSDEMDSSSSSSEESAYSDEEMQEGRTSGPNEASAS